MTRRWPAVAASAAQPPMGDQRLHRLADPRRRRTCCKTIAPPATGRGAIISPVRRRAGRRAGRVRPQSRHRRRRHRRHRLRARADGGACAARRMRAVELGPAPAVAESRTRRRGDRRLGRIGDASRPIERSSGGQRLTSTPSPLRPASSAARRRAGAGLARLLRRAGADRGLRLVGAGVRRLPYMRRKVLGYKVHIPLEPDLVAAGAARQCRQLCEAGHRQEAARADDRARPALARTATLWREQRQDRRRQFRAGGGRRADPGLRPRRGGGDGGAGRPAASDMAARGDRDDDADHRRQPVRRRPAAHHARRRWTISPRRWTGSARRGCRCCSACR